MPLRLKWSKLNLWIFPYISICRAAGATHSRNLLNSASPMLIFLNAKLWNAHTLVLYTEIYLCIVCTKNMWEFRFKLEYKWEKNLLITGTYCSFTHDGITWDDWLPEEDDLRLVFLTHSQWGSEADMSDSLSSQTQREREKYSKGERLEARGMK